MSLTLTALPAARAMRAGLPALRPEQSLAHAADLMSKHDVRELPVTRDGTLVGILTQRDMQAFRGFLEWTRVGTAMTPDPVTVTPETRIGTVARMLLDRCFNSVPVVGGSALLGMIGRVDLVRLLLEELTP